MMLASRITHVYQVFPHTPFQRIYLYSQNGRVSIVDIEEIILFSVIGLVLRTYFEDTCYEHIPPVKSG